MEQPYIDAERNATQEEIDKYLSDRGFWLEGKNLKHWTNGKYIIEDARPANVLKGKDGSLYFVDTIPHSVEYLDGAAKENATFAAKEQNLAIAQMLEGTTLIEAPKHSFKNFDEARQWGFEHIIGTYKNDATGEDIIVSKKAIKKYISASAVLKSIDKDSHLSTLKVLPQIIKTSLVKEIHGDKKENLDIKEIQRFYGAINYDGKKHPVKITVKATKSEGNKAYSYEVLDIENPDINPGLLQSGQQNVSEKLSEAFPHSDISIAKDTNNSETAKGNPQNPCCAVSAGLEKPA
jgi:hypothetical protein